MKKPPLFLLLWGLSVMANAQTNNQIVIGKVDSVQSKLLGEKRKIWVYTPESGPNSIHAKQGYPVLYLLDGDAHFSSVVGMIQQLSTVNGNMICPEMIVVAIPNINRTRDLTPTHVDSDPPFMSNAFSKTSGGGEKFIAFIEKELIPHIDSLYPTQPYKILIGHSFGGLSVMQTLILHPRLFNAYVAIDPSMWYNKGRFLVETKQALANKKYDGISLFLGIANTMNEGMTLARLAKDTTAGTRHIRSIFELDRHLKANKQNGLAYQSKYYPNDSHGSVPLITEYDALHFIFDYYPLKISQKDHTDTTTALADKYAAHFASTSRRMGYKVAPSESMINYLGYDALNNKHLRKAESLFKLNVTNYPDSYNVFDSYGDYFVAKKDTANAIANFKKALTINENAEIRQKLTGLQSGEMLKLTAEDLQKYVGEFEISGVGVTIKTFISQGVLKVSTAGRPEGELYATKLNEFAVRNVKGYRFRFEMNNNKPTALHASVPEGEFKAIAK